ncbi:MAG: aspartate-semialdehyde dehydrogenase, partial [Candidatus Aenigmarchaeota archaeon]|nr:aspartate-semialdehyde dehydrogenase [Candidatus Aenigmarchaeota archaeon]
MKKFKVGVLAATGAVGQNYVNLLENHPWFEITFLAASKDSESYGEAVSKRGWFVSSDIPENVKNMKVYDARNIEKAAELCDFVFSALGSDVAKELEPLYASELPVVSNSSAYRRDELVPMLIPEINADHAKIIPAQKKAKCFKNGFIAVKPNCSLQSYMKPIYALIKEGYQIDKMIVTTLQASSGAGRPGVPSLDLIDNIIPYIQGEESKSENEPYKILGQATEHGIKNYEGIKISANCARVPVRDGHTATVNFSFKDKKPSIEEIIKIWENFKGKPQEYNLPFAPKQPIVYRREENRPQPVLDREAGKGMAISVGRLRECEVFDYKFVCLSHNTIRGAAGG